MKDKRVRISIASLVILLVFAGLLHFVPISISFGQRQTAKLDSRNMSLQPGLYYVEVKKLMSLPDGMEAVSCGDWRSGRPVPCGAWDVGFKHGDARKDKPEVNPCGGDINTLLLNNIDMKYECTRCQKTWLQSSDDSKTEGES